MASHALTFHAASSCQCISHVPCVERKGSSSRLPPRPDSAYLSSCGRLSWRHVSAFRATGRQAEAAEGFRPARPTFRSEAVQRSNSFSSASGSNAAAPTASSATRPAVAHAASVSPVVSESDDVGRASGGNRVVVVGAGWAGLGAAHHLTKQVRGRDGSRRGGGETLKEIGSLTVEG